MNTVAIGLWSGLWTNLAAGTRLALFLRVRALDFRVSAGQYAMLVAASFAAWLAGGMARQGFPGTLDGGALVVGLGQVPLILLVCLLAASLLREPTLALALAIFITASDPVFELAAVAIHHALNLEAMEPYASWLNALFVAWGFTILLRAQITASGWRGWRSIGAAGLLIALLILFVVVFPRTELWTAPAEEQPQAAEGLVREDLFHLQGGLLEGQLAGLEPERPGVDDLYFIGAASYAWQDTFVNELDVVRRLMDERFDTAGRSLVLANHTSTLSAAPLATVTNLRTALEYVGKVINVEEDIAFVFLTTHGSQNGELSFEMPPLELVQLNPTLLARILADSGVKWKIVVISACFSGGFIEPLKDEHTLIVTASDATHSSFGCEYASDFTWFSRAFFDEALRATRSFSAAFSRARDGVAARERGEGLEPSNPQIYLGRAMKAKLESLERRLESAGPTVRAGL